MSCVCGQDGINCEYPLCQSDYKDCSERDWVEYEFGTIEYDFNIHPEAARRIRSLFDRLDK
jgi:hypothetical protein